MSHLRHLFLWPRCPSPACLLAVVCLALAAASLHAQTPAASTTNQRKTLIYRIATNDSIRIGVFQEPDLDIIGRVDMKGTINLPLLGSVKVVGLSIAEAQATVETAYRDGRYLRNPQVTITVEVYAPREVSIQGQIKSPGRYVLPIEQTMTVIELVTKANGFTDTAKGTAVNITRINPDGTKQVFTVDVESLIKGKNKAKASDDAFVLLPGDIVYVPERLI
jgi:polysaccharide export outer membrane protein